MYYVFNDELIY